MKLMKDITKRYSNGEVTVVWKPHMCIHSGICFRGLPGVFDPRVRPWVNAEGATSDQIVDQILKCPSGALSILTNEKSQTNQNTMENSTESKGTEVKIMVMGKGPLIVKGDCVVVDETGNETIKRGQVALCRCGASQNKPYCDGSHRAANTL